MAQKNKSWERCLEIIKCNVADHEFNTWFSPIRFVNFEKETQELQLNVPTSYFYEILDGQYRTLMFNVVWREFGKGVHIRYSYQIDNIEVKQNGSGTHTKLPKGPDDTFRTPKKPATPEFSSQLNPEYRFENFIEGESNKLLRSVGLSIAENPKQTTFNPLFIYGSSGVGKTHLVNAIGTALNEKFPKRRVLYVGAHQFTVQYTESIRNNTFNDFIQFYQTIDTLIIDDVQELAGQTKTQLAFFHIFNHLKMNGKQIILTSDRAPATMQGMEERLLTRFKWGLMAELEKPNQELCRRILQSKIRHDGLEIPEDIIDYIAASANDSVRDLEGILNSLMAYAVVYNREIDLDMAEQVVRRTVKTQKHVITLENILQTCSQLWDISQDDIFSKSRKANIVSVRQTVMYLAQKYTKLTASRIGQLIGGRNHATVLHAIAQVRDRISTDKLFAQKVEHTEKTLKQG